MIKKPLTTIDKLGKLLASFAGFLLVLAVASSCLFSPAAAQVRPPNYSPDAIPETSFTCENKITGGYYADAEAECQLFHVCVQVSEYEVRRATSQRRGLRVGTRFQVNVTGT